MCRCKSHFKDCRPQLEISGQAFKEPAGRNNSLSGKISLVQWGSRVAEQSKALNRDV